MSRLTFRQKSLVDSVDELIKMVDNWGMNAADAALTNKRNDGRNKKRSHANAMPDQLMFDQTPAKKSRLLKSAEKLRNCLTDLAQDAKVRFAHVMSDVIEEVYKVELTESQMNELIIAQMSRPKHDRGDFAVPCFRFSKILKSKPIEIAEKLSDAMNKAISSNAGELFLTNPFVKVEALKGYLNIYLKSEYMGSIIDLILNENDSFLDTLPYDSERCKDIKRVMVEYSQPNTHKAFHVGHMRNVALGDCLVRLYEHCGYEVVAANYFGDEGAHVAKCLWLLLKKIDSGMDLDQEAPKKGKGEWLGAFYTEAVQKLSIKTYTMLPYPGVIAALVLKKDKHPSLDAPPNWNVVEVDYGQGKQATVVCGGEGYEVGDYVPYVPLGGKFNGKDVVPRDMKGVSSNGVIMSALELGVTLPPPKEADKSAKPFNGKDQESKPNVEDSKEQSDGKQKKKGKKSKKQKKQQKKEPKKVDKRILLLTNYCDAEKLQPGQSLINVGRIPDTDIDAKEDIEAIVGARDQEQRKILHRLENGDEELVALWQKTRKWCLDDFHKIYDWLGARFDHDFCESECSAPSRDLVDKYYKNGTFVKDSGAIGINLGSDLGFCMLLKSDGTGLYATKDLALAQIKFEKYQIDKSIYVVDSAQSHHFKQVFATLKAMNYKQAENCYHLAYAFVTLPEGRMASRQGRVVLFSQLTKLLSAEISQKILNSKKNAQNNDTNNNSSNADADTVVTSGDGAATAAADKKSVEKKPWVDMSRNDEKEWTAEERSEAQRLISVGTIRYGMLNHDPNKEIVFDLEQWSDASGDTGPYLMYQYARVSSIGRKVDKPNNVTADYSLLNKSDEKMLLYELSQFQNRVQIACDNANPSSLCSYLYDIAQAFSSWFSKKENSIKACEDDVLKVTRLNFVDAVAQTLKKGLSLLGIQVLERM